MSPNPAPISDEELSAVLDGEADQATVDRVAADPVASARLAAFRSVASGLRDEPVPTLDPRTVDTMVARAIDEGVGTGGAPAPDAGAVVTPMAAPRRATRVPPWLVAAAVIAFVAVGLGLVFAGTRDSGGQDQAATTAEQGAATADSDRTANESGSVSADGSGSDGATPSTSAPSAPSATTVPEGGQSFGSASLIDLGTFTDADALRTALADSFPTGPGVGADASVPTIGQIDRCSLLMKQVFSLKEEPRATGVAIVGGTQLLVYEFAAPSAADGTPTTFVTANDADSCKAFLSFERDPS